MKRIILILSILLLIVGCRTSRKVVTHEDSSQIHHESVTVDRDSAFNEKVENIIHTTDSIVEIYQEYMMIDSTGKVIAHEIGRSRQKYSGYSSDQGQAYNLNNVITQHTSENDSTSNHHDKSREVQKSAEIEPPWKWHVLICFIAFMYVVIIYQKNNKK